MKKVLVGFAAAALAGVMCVSFVACGGGASIESVIEDAEKIVSKKVTAEQWKAALAEENFKNVKVKQVYIYEAGTKGEKDWGKQTTLSIFSCNGANAFIKYSGIAEGAVQEEEGYADFEGKEYRTIRDGQIIELYEEDGKWHEMEGISLKYSYIGAGFMSSLEGSYESYTYSEEEKGYIYKADFEAGNLEITYIVKFQNGKLASYSNKQDDSTYVNTFETFSATADKRK